MFEIGKRYKVRMIIDGQEADVWRIVEQYEHPIVKFADAHFEARNEYLPARTREGEIVNVTSADFISAVEDPPAESSR